MAKKKTNKRGNQGAFAAAMAAKAAANTAQPVVHMGLFQQNVGRAPEKPFEHAAQFLTEHSDQSGVKQALQGLKLTKVMSTMARNAPLQPHQEAQITDAASTMGWKAPTQAKS